MIKAVLKNGRIQPLDPLPADWGEGQELAIDAADGGGEPAMDDDWAGEVRSAMSDVPREDHERLLAAVREHQQEQKRLMRERNGTRA